VEVQLVEAKLADSVVAVTNLTSPHHTIRKVFKKEYYEVMSEKCYKGQNFFLSWQIGTQMTYYVKMNCFHSENINNYNNNVGSID
jgi:hypothetical protein